MNLTRTFKRIAIMTVIAVPAFTHGQGVVTNIPPLPMLSNADKQRFRTPGPDTASKLQAVWQEKQASLTRLTNGPIDAIVAELTRPAKGTVILWQHMPEATPSEINTFRRGWLVWWPPRFDVEYGIMAKEPDAVLDRAYRATLFTELLRRDDRRALEFLTMLCTDNPPTLQHAAYARAVLEHQPTSDLFTKATAPYWKELLDSDNPLLLGMALQLAPGHAARADLEIALRRAASSDWISLKYLAVEALASLPRGIERDSLAHTIDPIRQISPLPALIADTIKKMEDAQPPARPYGSPGAGSPSGQP